MRIGFLGPEGTFSHQALLSSPPAVEAEHVPLPTIYETVMAVPRGQVDLALVPIENALEGSIDVTLDALATDAAEAEIVGELVLEIRNCLISHGRLALEEIEVVHSHPQPNAQCAHFLRRRLPQARVQDAASTAGAVRAVLAEPELKHAALGNRLASELYGGTILREGIDDLPGNQTRFVWLARRGGELATAPTPPGPEQLKTSLVFWGAGDEQPGWLVSCLSEFSQREISLTRIESRPRRIGLGHYMFFADLAPGGAADVVGEAVAALSRHCEVVRVLGAYAPATLAPR